MDTTEHESQGTGDLPEAVRAALDLKAAPSLMDKLEFASAFARALVVRQLRQRKPLNRQTFLERPSRRSKRPGYVPTKA